MREENILSFNGKETFVKNIGNIVDAIIKAIALFFGISMIAAIQDTATLVFGLIVFAFIFFKYFRVRFSTVYNHKKGGLIIFD